MYKWYLVEYEWKWKADKKYRKEAELVYSSSPDKAKIKLRSWFGKQKANLDIKFNKVSSIYNGKDFNVAQKIALEKNPSLMIMWNK
jgi:hypothetical protein